MTKLSIIIAVYNAVNDLEECIVSTQSQTLKDIEIICVDDCSTDNSMDILKSLQADDNRIQIFQNGKNSGAGPTRNLGMKHAMGEFICFMDPDDYYASNTCLEELYKAVINNNVDCVGGNLLEFYNNDPSKAKDWGKGTFTENKIMDYHDYPFSIGYTRFIFRRSVIEKIGAKFPSYRRYQDPVWFVSVMTHIQKFYALAIPVYMYRKDYGTIKWTTDKVDCVLKGKAQNLSTFREHNYPNHYAREVKELNNFIAMVIYKTRFDNAVIRCVKQYNAMSDDINYGPSKIVHLLKYGLFLLKLKLLKG
jgi:glycosyltransferase involved in cell wall biosynthesis